MTRSSRSDGAPLPFDEGEAYRLRVRFRILGPLEVTRNGDRLPLGGPKQRLVLAHLVTRPNETVSADLLIDALWGDEPPNAARSSLQAYVSHLRKALGGDRLEGRPPGYLLHATADEIDAARFEALVGRARRLRTTDLPAATRLLREGLGLWQGEPLADLATEPSLQPEIERLSEMRLSAVEDRIELGLALGRHDEEIPEIERLVARHPLRERLRAQLMLALYRAGRQADALDVYRRLRTSLDRELGVEPSPAVERLQRQILAQDSSLELRGEPLRGYRLLGAVGTGPLGVVHRAFEAQTERNLAIKVLGARTANQPGFVRAFDAQARRVAQVENPHLLPVLDWWREPDAAYLVMRLMPGGNLADRLAAMELSEAKVLLWTEQVGSALEAIHRHGLSHGDLHPNNVLFDDDGNAYLSDVAVGFDPAGNGARRAHAASAYRAPERAHGSAASPAADIYAFATLVRELLGHSPLDARAAEAHVLARAMAPEAGDRPTAVADLVSEIRQLVVLPDTAGPPLTAVPRPARNPYKGLRAFEEADAVDFEGRDDLVRTLVARMAEQGDASRLLVLVGPSGSGKSSVLNAGLVPALRNAAIPGSDEWFVAAMTPGVHPFAQLERALLAVAVGSSRSLAEELDNEDGWQPLVARILPPGAVLLLLIDQFEELFTLVGEDETRRRFMAALARTVDDPRSSMRIVIALRADFYDRPLSHEQLGRQMAVRTQVVPPLTPEELERVISEPAQRAGLSLERGLATRIVAEMSEHPGALPLLQYVLSELWERRHLGTVSLAAYEASGGLSGAVARRAEDLVQEMEANELEAARQLFLRLVEPGEGAPDTGRRVRRSELDVIDEHRRSVDLLIDRFARYRLLLIDRDQETREPTVQLAHEALLRAWPRLRSWVDEARDDLRTQRRLAAAAAQWQEAGRESSFLLIGSRLEQMRTWAGSNPVRPSSGELEYLAASQAEHDRLQADDARRQAREQAAERRAVTRLRALVVTLGIGALLAGVLSLFALVESQRAAQVARDAQARELAAAADANLGVDPERSILLALEAADVTEKADGSVLREPLEALHQAMQTSRVLFTLPEGGGVAFSPDGRRLITAGATGLTVWGADTGRALMELGGGRLLNLSLAGDGSRMATTGEDGVLRLWDSTTGAQLATFSTPSPMSPALNRDGTLLAVSDATGFVRAWDTRSGDVLFSAPVASPVGIAFSPDGRRLAVGSLNDEAVVVWDLAAPDRPLVLTGHTDGVVDIAWSPDGRYLASASSDLSAKIWDATTGAEVRTLSGHSGFVYGIDWSADGRMIATGATDATVRVWNPETGAELLTLPGLAAGNVVISPDGHRLAGSGLAETKIWDISPQDPGEVLTVAGHGDLVFQAAFSPDGTRLATASWDGTARIWDIGSGETVTSLSGHAAPVYRVAFSPDGTRVATASLDGTVRIWDAASGTLLQLLPLDPGDVPSLAYSPDSRLVAAGTRTGDVIVWEVATGQRAFVLQGHSGQVADIAFSADGNRIGTAGWDNTIRVWDSTSGRALLPPLRLADRANALAFSPDGRWLAGSGFNPEIVLWDAASGAEVRRLTGHAGIVWSLAFSPGGDRLASTGFDRTVRLWDPATGEEVLRLTEGDALTGVAFSPDGSNLASVGLEDGSAHVYALDPEALMALARERVTRALTPQECRQYLHMDVCPMP